MTNLQPKPREDKVSLCEYCNCMTKTINRKCGKCGGEKMGDSKSKPRAEEARWKYDYRILSFVDERENVITEEEFEKYKGKYDNPSDELLDAILELLRTFKKET